MDTSSLQSTQPEMYVPLNRRNYILGIINGIFINIGFRLTDPSTILPLLLLRLSGRTWMVGVLQAVCIVAPAIPAIFASRVIDAAEHKLPIFNLYSWVRFGLLVGMAVAVLAANWVSGMIVAVILLLLYAGRLLAEGISVLAFLDIVAKSTPTTKRGSFWMWRQSIGLPLVLLVAVPLVEYLLGDQQPVGFPLNYGVMMLIGAALCGTAWLAFSMVEEPPARAASHLLSNRQQIARARRMWRHDKRYRRLMRVVLLLQAAGSIAPFLTTLGAKAWGMPDSIAATFITVQLLAQAVGSVALGRVSDRLGNRMAMVIASLLGIGASLVAAIGVMFVGMGEANLLGHVVSYRLLVLWAAFGLNGLFMAFLNPGYRNYIMDIAPPRKRSSYIGFAHLYILPIGLVPLAFGWIAEFVSFELVFGIATIFAVAAFWLGLKVSEPRTEDDARGTIQ